MVDNIQEYKKLLESRLNKGRFYHSLCVADEAKRLAEKYGGNEEKCYLAGLLHDITKNSSPEEHLEIFKNNNITLSDIEMSAEKLWHAVSGAIYIKNNLNITDEEILDAVRFHTTAKADMSLTAKILYLADFTSKDRNYPDVNIIRNLVDKSLDEAFIYALKYSIIDLTERSKAIHPDTVAAFNETVLNLEDN